MRIIITSSKRSRNRKHKLDRMAAMLSRLGGRGYKVQENPAVYGVDCDFDPDPDSDFDWEGEDKGPRRCVSGDERQPA